MGDDDVKRLILARRARFVAAALAGLNAAMCGGATETEPQPCLSPLREDAGQDGGTPQPCLSPRQEPDDAGDAASDSPDDSGDAGPQPCLVPPLDGG